MAKKRGLAPKPPEETKQALIQLRINALEKEQFARAAKLDNRPLSSWIRDRLLRLSQQELAEQSGSYGGVQLPHLT